MNSRLDHYALAVAKLVIRSGVREGRVMEGDEEGAEEEKEGTID